MARIMFMKVGAILMAVLGWLRCPFDTDGLAVSQIPCCGVSNWWFQTLLYLGS